MRQNIYSIFDSATAAYMRPFFMQSDNQALRAFTDIATQADHEVNRHPKDYTLVRLGTFDDNNGKIKGEDVTGLATALEVQSKAQKVDRQAILDLNQVAKEPPCDQ